MNCNELSPAKTPTFYFVGVSTAQSSIMKIFPAWAKQLGISQTIKGIDCSPSSDREVYRKIVTFLKEDKLSLGSLVTTHKLDLLEAARDYFDWLDPYALQLAEVSSISKRDGLLRGHATDHIASGLSFDTMTKVGCMVPNNPEVCIHGAGGSAIALTIHFCNIDKSRCPSKIFVTDNNEKRLKHMEKVHKKMEYQIPIEYIPCRTAKNINNNAVEKLREGAIVINATGLGKDTPGSPLTDAVVFPKNSLVWDFNYRGDLMFLDQAKVQQEIKNLTIHDGWNYFIHGWLSVISEVFNIFVPSEGPEFKKLSDIAANLR